MFQPYFRTVTRRPPTFTRAAAPRLSNKPAASAAASVAAASAAVANAAAVVSAAVAAAAAAVVGAAGVADAAAAAAVVVAAAAAGCACGWGWLWWGSVQRLGRWWWSAHWVVMVTSPMQQCWPRPLQTATRQDWGIRGCCTALFKTDPLFWHWLSTVQNLTDTDTTRYVAHNLTDTDTTHSHGHGHWHHMVHKLMDTDTAHYTTSWALTPHGTPHTISCQGPLTCDTWLAL